MLNKLYNSRTNQAALRLGFYLSMLLIRLSVHAAQTVSLSWDSSADPNVTGYKIYYGTNSHVYANCMDVKNVTNAKIAVPSDGVTYYFAATTYDSAGNESDYSNEAVYTLPAPMLTGVSHAGGRFSFTVSGNAGSVYVVEASTNLVDWVPVQTNTAPFLFTDANAAGFGQRFYRTASL
jgi:hypothetical protein